MIGRRSSVVRMFGGSWCDAITRLVNATGGRPNVERARARAADTTTVTVVSTAQRRESADVPGQRASQAPQPLRRHQVPQVTNEQLLSGREESAGENVCFVK